MIVSEEHEPIVELWGPDRGPVEIPPGYVKIPGSREIIPRPPIRDVPPGGFSCCAGCTDGLPLERRCGNPECPLTLAEQARVVDLPELEIEKPRRPFWRRLRRRRKAT